MGFVNSGGQDREQDLIETSKSGYETFLSDTLTSWLHPSSTALTLQQKQVFEAVFIRQETEARVAKRIKVGQSRISQIMNDVYGKIKSEWEKKGWDYDEPRPQDQMQTGRKQPRFHSSDLD